MGQRESKERKKWVDILRAIAMILVIYGHRSSGWTEYYVFTSPIKIPLFFAITGYVFNDAKGDFGAFIKKLWRTVIVPWLVISILPYLIFTPLKGISFLAENLISVLTGKNYWYMPCCIAAEIIWFCILKYVRSMWKIGLIVAILFAVGLALYTNSMLSVFMINRSLTAQFFLYTGKIYRVYEPELKDKINNVPVLVSGTVLYVFLGILTLVLYPGQCLDVHMCRYYNICICGVMIWVGIYVLAVFVSNRIKRYPNWLVLIGQHTLVIYLLHNYLVKAFYKGFSIFHIPANRLTNVFLTLIVCLTGVLISQAINYLAPELMGKKRAGSIEAR